MASQSRHRHLTGVARRLRRDPTGEERLLRWWLRGSFGLHWRRRAPIGRYVVDFVAFEERIVVEVDGCQHADSERDRIRRSWLRSQRLAVLRFWNDDIRLQPGVVMNAIEAVIEGPAP